MKAAVAVAMLIFASHGMAYTNSEAIQVEITGVIIAPVCEVEAPVEVKLGEVEREHMSVAGATSTTENLRINLTQCSPVTSKATLSFSGLAYPDPTFANVIYGNELEGGAQDIGLQIFNVDGNPLVNLGNGVTYEVAINPETAATHLLLAARMYSPHGQATVGSFRSSVTINFVYQ